MNKPCKNCEKALEELAADGFEQGCLGTCDAFNEWADDICRGLDRLIKLGEEALAGSRQPM